MSLFNRVLRLFVVLLLLVVSGVSLAQSTPEFIQPTVEGTGGQVSSFLTGSFETFGSTDILYINSGVDTGLSFTVTAGELLNQPGYTNLLQNQITFTNTLSASAAIADLNNDGHPDYAFGLYPLRQGGSDFCVYYGTGLGVISPGSYAAAESGCLSFPIQGGALPNFAYIAAVPFRTGLLPQLILEDKNNGYIYTLANTGAGGNNGVLAGFTVKGTYQIPAADGSGPIYTGDFNGDGNTDFLINNQTSHRVTLYLGKGDGTFQAPVYVPVNGNVFSMLLRDMNSDGILDLVTEVDNGVIEIQLGSYSSAAFGASVGGTTAVPSALYGNGGHLAAIGDVNGDGIPDILTTTPIGLSVLLGQGHFSYALKGIYNIGPGRTAFALADIDGDGNLDLAVDSPEGVAVVGGNGDGSFRTSLAYPAGQPALNGTLADFNNDGKLDVVVATGTTQGQVLLGNGAGGFAALPAATNTLPSPNPTLWSAVLTGDFDGDGKQDLLYSLTGLPLPTPGSGAGTGLYLQYGNGDGTFTPLQAISNQTIGAPGDNNFYGESVAADLNGDGITDIANLDTYYYDTLISQKRGGGFILGYNLQEDSGADDANDLDSFSQVAAGFFSVGRTNRQDLVFQDDANITPYVNSGDGVHFTAMPALSMPPPAGSYYGGTIIIADVDGDGNGDIIVPYQNLAATLGTAYPGTANQLYIWYGNGDGTFQNPIVTTLSRNYYLAQVVDMNNDGLPDLVLSDGYIVAILYNAGNRTFGNEQHFLAGQGINSISVADINGDGSLDLVVANGGATISDAVAIGGLTLSSISLTPNPDVSTGGVTVLLNTIKTKPVTGSVVVLPEPSQYQATFTITATLTPTAGVAAPTGTVTFFVDSVQAGVGTVVAGTSSSTASITVPAGNSYADGPHVILAQYNGDVHNSPVPLYGTHSISGSQTTTTEYLCVGPTPSCPSSGLVQVPASFPTNLTMYYGQTFNGVASASANDGSTLTGLIDFNDDYNGTTTTLCQLSVVAGSTCPPAVGTTIGTSVGTNVFTSMYTGDANHSPSTSEAITINVLADTTTATLAGSPNPSPQGQPVTFTATLTGNFAPPTGTVTFTELFPPTTVATQIGIANLVPGAGNTSTATLILSTLPVGTDTIVASYAATMDFGGASATTTEVISPVLPTRTTLTSSLNPSTVNQAVTFTATVTLASGAATPVPSGIVTFLDGNITLGTGALNASGVAAFTTSSLTVGSHTITATASGSTVTGPSSVTLTQVVDALPPPGSVNFKITVTPSPVSVGVGNAAVLLVTVTPLNGFTETINLGCSNLPTEAACAFAAGSFASGGGSTQLLLSTMAPHSCGSAQPYFTGSNGGGRFGGWGVTGFALPALAGLVAIFLPGRRRWLRALVALVAVAGALQMSGCSTCTDLGTRPNTYTVQVYGSAAATSEVESQSVTLNVTI